MVKASKASLGAVLQQLVGSVWSPVTVFSQKLPLPRQATAHLVESCWLFILQSVTSGNFWKGGSFTRWQTVSRSHSSFSRNICLILLQSFDIINLFPNSLLTSVMCAVDISKHQMHFSKWLLCLLPNHHLGATCVSPSGIWRTWFSQVLDHVLEARLQTFTAFSGSNCVRCLLVNIASFSTTACLQTTSWHQSPWN